MSIFVPLSDDVEGTISAVSLGDYILSIMKKLKPDSASTYYEKLIGQFAERNSEQVIKNPLELFKLLLSEHEMVLAHLKDAIDNNSTSLIMLVTENNIQVEKEVLLTIGEANRGVEEYFTVLMYMLQLRFKESDLMDEAVDCFLQALTKDNLFPELRIKIMQLLYNTLIGFPKQKARVLVSILEYASNSNCFGVIIQYIKFIYEWIKTEQLDIEQKVKVYHLIAKELENYGKLEESYLFWRLRAEHCTTAALIESQETINTTSELCIKSLKNPNILCYDFLLKYKCVLHLDNTGFKDVYQLVVIMTRGNEDDLKKFNAENPKFFQKYDIDMEECLQKIRMLSLELIVNGLCSITMSELSSKVGLSAQETEELVVAAIGRGVINALEDQQNQILYIKSAMKREFNTTRWEELLKGLNVYKNSISKFNTMKPTTAKQG